MTEEKSDPEDNKKDSNLKKHGISVVTHSVKMEVKESEANKETTKRVIKEVGSQINKNLIDDNRQLDN